MDVVRLPNGKILLPTFRGISNAPNIQKGLRIDFNGNICFTNLIMNANLDGQE
jgi:hypothetical protein